MKFLEGNSIKVDLFCVDPPYLTQESVYGLPLKSVDDVYKEYPKFSMVIGFSDYISAKKNLTKKSNVKIFFFDAPHHLDFFDYKYVLKNQDEFSETYKMLEDQKSKDIMVAFINAKISGDPGGLYSLAESNQYFVNLIHLEEAEVFVDCGAYDGDTILAFVEKVKGKYSKIYAFEPDKDNQKKLLENINKAGLSNIELIKKGSWSSKTSLRFSSDANMTSAITNGGISVPVDSIDNVINDNVTLIKMDVEGAELESLKGAKKHISKNKPKLAICIYHKPEDLITIPQYIRGLESGYKFYLRHHQFISWETVLYAVRY
jgi:FkbM family methyltransferase